ncbi:hypothetical protein GTW20_01645 [Nocardiopsis alba]|uniref:Uncharacterized protein n=1 Tax=Nocardiopsis alba TaxID=53437 RepID=A0A7K2IME2_9ACTN|nr:hypothetical protein [Nocardiopsis alba]MYR31007.1 hypothetical protein [Nocardiopsis alba]
MLETIPPTLTTLATGALGGIILKGAIDAIHNGIKEKREDSRALRNEKMAAYMELLAACGDVETTKKIWIQNKEKTELWENERCLSEDEIDLTREEEREFDRTWGDATRRLTRALASIDLLCPSKIALAARSLAMYAHYQAGHPEVKKREEEFVFLARKDLGTRRHKDWTYSTEEAPEWDADIQISSDKKG